MKPLYMKKKVGVGHMMQRRGGEELKGFQEIRTENVSIMDLYYGRKPRKGPEAGYTGF
jgi:hypothetical protein